MEMVEVIRLTTIEQIIIEEIVRQQGLRLLTGLHHVNPHRQDLRLLTGLQHDLHLHLQENRLHRVNPRLENQHHHVNLHQAIILARLVLPIAVEVEAEVVLVAAVVVAAAECVAVAEEDNRMVVDFSS